MRFFRIRDVEKFSGLSRASIYRLMREGKFPRPVRLGERAVAWTIDPQPRTFPAGNDRGQLDPDHARLRLLAEIHHHRHRQYGIEING